MDWPVKLEPGERVLWSRLEPIPPSMPAGLRHIIPLLLQLPTLAMLIYFMRQGMVETYLGEVGLTVFWGAVSVISLFCLVSIWRIVKPYLPALPRQHRYKQMVVTDRRVVLCQSPAEPVIVLDREDIASVALDYAAGSLAIVMRAKGGKESYAFLAADDLRPILAHLPTAE